jgi:NADPH:quinone reductase-like Zn-dependent oxidoreductase
MKAVVAERYGGPEVLALGERPDPKLGPDSVLVRVAAASINPVDYKIVRGHLDAAFPTYLPLIPGWDVAGEVAAVGPAVTHVAVGQRVYGYARKDYVGDGTWAQLVAVPARGVAPAPESVDVVAASCLPLAGLTAYQALTDKLAVGPGDTVLVHAASGGVGTFATQIAVALGARVVGTANERNADYLRDLGAQPVAYGEGLVDRVRAVAPDGVDAVVDLVGGEALRLSPTLVRDPHRVVSVVDAATVKELGGQYLFVRPDVEDLGELARLVDDGRLRVHVQDRFPWAAVRTAVERAETGHVRGKLTLGGDW